ncbi:MAG: VOC family protein [Armatimonadetes bacterium]|nr:VOC family protein [Armatimonadota bacterium]
MTKTHLSLNVTDVEKSTKWYEAFFGQPPHKVREGYANFDVELPALKLALNQHKPGGQGSLNHLGILVDSSEEVWRAKERLEKAGLTTQVEESVDCCHATQDKFWVSDPDKNMWEIYTILNDNPAISCCAGDQATACCAGDQKACCS